MLKLHKSTDQIKIPKARLTQKILQKLGDFTRISRKPLNSQLFQVLPSMEGGNPTPAMRWFHQPIALDSGEALGDHHQAMVLFGRGECLAGGKMPKDGWFGYICLGGNQKNKL